jgi:hypothetical protein
MTIFTTLHLLLLLVGLLLTFNLLIRNCVANNTNTNIHGGATTSNTKEQQQ